ncbi:hypothetical protein G9F73_007330 [Clostridium estertheticum]|uniref:hypothetical protein n=1 Tax=Clostridium estertheticum TaxID=238834 RepID=UPI0013EE7D03|nr:hypothetical protein [Clostridium estertheticum]MBZ9607626.1 hypothetical protein [Clostridium estertheticum]
MKDLEVAYRRGIVKNIIENILHSHGSTTSALLSIVISFNTISLIIIFFKRNIVPKIKKYYILY